MQTVLYKTNTHRLLYYLQWYKYNINYFSYKIVSLKSATGCSEDSAVNAIILYVHTYIIKPLTYLLYTQCHIYIYKCAGRNVLLNVFIKIRIEI